MLKIPNHNLMSAEDFFNSHIVANLPVILSGLASDSGAMTRWSFDFFSKVYGARMVEAVDRSGSSRRLSMESLIKGFEQSDRTPLYLRSLKIVNLDSALLDDVPRLPHFSFDLFQSAKSTRDFLKEIFIGAAGSGTPLHVDLWLSHSWMLLVTGVKEWIIVSPSVSKQFDLEKKTRLKAFNENITASLEGVEYYRFLQYPGEIVYVPSGWWHAVTNVKDSIGVSFNFMDAFSLPDGFASTQSRGAMFDELLADYVPMLQQSNAIPVNSLVADRLREEYLAFIDARLAQIERKKLELKNIRHKLLSSNL
ncbi:cupin-like domain-containing protein [Pseudomonas syringae]|uniref:cupin-like domain-containing protein n=1 Tax=Pseudomonas syringae TaxID=317 RepID=UPI0011D1210C|nr:cupin-like domain-containing protein [Pseudomonas syringae]